jgi:hypothetical protein
MASNLVELIRQAPFGPLAANPRQPVTQCLGHRLCLALAGEPSQRFRPASTELCGAGRSVRMGPHKLCDVELSEYIPLARRGGNAPPDKDLQECFLTI